MVIRRTCFPYGPSSVSQLMYIRLTQKSDSPGPRYDRVAQLTDGKGTEAMGKYRVTIDGADLQALFQGADAVKVLMEKVLNQVVRRPESCLWLLPRSRHRVSGRASMASGPCSWQSRWPGHGCLRASTGPRGAPWASSWESRYAERVTTGSRQCGWCSGPCACRPAAAGGDVRSNAVA